MLDRSDRRGAGTDTGSPPSPACIFALVLSLAFVSGASVDPEAAKPLIGNDEDIAGGAVLAQFGPIPITSLPLHRADAASDLGRTRDLEIVARGELKMGQTLGAALRRQGVAPGTIHLVASRLRPLFDFRRAQPGHRFRLTQSADGSLVDFRYSISPEERFRLYRSGDHLLTEREKVELRPRRARLAGVIRSSLYDAIRDQGERPQLAGDFADLFAWEVDFSRSVQPGDEFAVLYERLYAVGADGEEDYVRPGRILAARYRGRSSEHSAVFFEDDEGRGGYYREDGSAVERAFLAAPLKFSRVTSDFSSSRYHPILKINRPHYGIDYAAPEGTPIWAVAEGKVIYRGWGGGFGNLVKIRHANGYVSYYSHLSRFESGLQTGQRVKQKQVIGYVGKTGLATGPHVCFRVARDGHYVNPVSIRSPVGRSVSDELWSEFQLVRDDLLANLDAQVLAVTQDAL